MTRGDDAVRALREALRLSPDNLPLRKHLAATLVDLGRYSEAEKEYRQALARDPHNSQLKTLLAQAFYRQGKRSEAMVLVEDLLRLPDTPAPAYLLHGRLLFDAGDARRAIRAYRLALEEDTELADPQLAERLGIAPDGSYDEDHGEVVGGRVRRPAEAGDGDVEVSVERPMISFADVGGMEKLKEEIRLKIIHPLTHPDIYEAYGKAVGGGILLYGPPGCGKTYLARATAGEVQAAFISVGINDVLDMWLGQSESKLHELFEQARQSRPCVLFFDEVDALGASRADMRQSSSRHLVNQFLAELDGIKSSNEGVLVLAATNAPWHLDSAFRRPGRFDRIIFVPPPDASARAAIARILLRGKPAENIDYGYVAKKTANFSGADIKAVVDVAVEAKLKEALAKGVPKPLATKDLVAATKALKPTTKEWFATARNYALYSNQGGIYDDILDYLKLR